MSIQFVVFKLSNEEFAVEVATVEAIITIQAITKIPHAPNYVVGVTNLRGNIVPVIDLKTRLGLTRTDPGPDSRIIVAVLHDQKVGMVVDSVSQVLETDDSQIEPSPQLTSSIDSSYIRGIVKIEKSLVVMLDLEQIFITETTKR